ncbi:MAG: hypothetical protein FJ399_10390 [Verrucomicrobia bacterium]|nr:hypothetical protein [Verrucomicrobiota bacterium]
MKTPNVSSRALTAAMLAAFIVTGVSAQTAGTPVPVTRQDPQTRAREIAAYRDALSAGRSHARAGSIASAEDALTAVNKSARNTAAWHLETAQRLLQVASQLAREGRPNQVNAVARRILEQLEQAEALARDGRTRAAAQSIAGFVHERYFGDAATAAARYQAALQSSPTSPQAREGVQRLQRNGPPGSDTPR